MEKWGPRLAVVLLGGILVGVGAYVAVDPAAAPAPATTTPSIPSVSTSASPPDTSVTTLPPPPVTTLPERPRGVVPGYTVGRPWGVVDGLTMFRGNPTRTWYGTGPLPNTRASELWRYPDLPMCSHSSVGGESRLWCGTGWTGQPVVWERPDGVVEVIVGAYDGAVHFVDAASGLPTREPFQTGDLVKGSVTLDPDGYPLLYFGSRDNRLRVVALDREPVEELWSLHASAVPGIWNDDWDSNPVVVDDLLYEGGENGWFFAIRLHRGYSADGSVTVSPTIVAQMPGWTDDLISRVGRNVSIESSVAVYGTTAYFANSGGRVVGVDVSGGEPEVVFDYWVGDDVDATVVIDEEGSLYVAAEYERDTARAREVGQLLRLDPRREDDPRVWGVAVPPEGGVDGGIWATPAYHRGHLYVSTNTGRLLVVEATTGEVVWEDEVGWHAWSSPVVVEDHLVVGTCSPPGLRVYRLDEPTRPELLWTVEADGCIESTPAVWKGIIYVGSRDGYLRAYGPG
ncbi:MAG: hypothetical protein KatS3mg011_1608 [Acidimicrobiia bacterium]|nr:MAG: hypothetical protein KatS3mg011_1608 [Acidimicrobiia bacterium]